MSETGTVIDKFEGPYEFLSNFYMAPFIYGRIVYPSAEHAFQAAKTNMEIAKVEIALLATPGQAKRAGRKLVLISDWEKIKDRVMLSILESKFLSHPDLAAKLLLTGDASLVEGNTWHDNYWGICGCNQCSAKAGTARNQLGKSLMCIRNRTKHRMSYINCQLCAFSFDTREFGNTCPICKAAVWAKTK